MPDAFAQATGMLRQKPKSASVVVKPTPELETYRRQRETESAMTKAIRKGDKTLADIHQQRLGEILWERSEPQRRANRKKGLLSKYTSGP